MTELLTAAQMRGIEQAAVDSGSVTGLTLMERAGQGVVKAIFEEWPELAVHTHLGDKSDCENGHSDQTETPPRAAILCGPGNNGGDGFVIARVLHELGWKSDVYLYGRAENLPPDAQENYARWCRLGPVGDAAELRGWVGPSFDLVVDALFGTGLTRPMDAALCEIHKFMVLHPKAKIVSVDAVSGIDLDSGQSLCMPGAEHFIDSDLTISFHCAKVGHYLGDACFDVAKIKVVDIGLADFHDDTDVVEYVDARAVDYGLAKGAFPASGGHKFSYGHALILSGPSGHTGAARLSARGALRIGAGVVTLGVPAAAQAEVAAHVTSVMQRPIETANDVEKTLKDKRINAICLGPALGLERAKPLVSAVLDAGLEARPTVLDADALSAFEDDPSSLFAMLHENCVLTPHGGEFARLFPDIAAKLNTVPTRGPAYSKVDATREAAKRAGCVVLFKGADTVIADPDGRCAINAALYERSAPWLATAGAGDVLAGFITGLLARGFAPMHAAEAAAWLHVESAQEFGPGLIAEDLPEQLPAVLRQLDL